MTKAKLYKLGNTILSLLITIVACYYLFNILIGKIESNAFYKALTTFIARIDILLYVLVLFVINWSLELWKWRLLIKKVQEIDIIQSIQSISLGISLALITPNRIGELGGRLLHIKKPNRISALYYHSFSSLSQLLVTILFGLIGLAFFSEELKLIQILPQGFIIVFTLLIGVVLIVLFFSSKKLNKGASFFSKKFKREEISEIEFSLRLRVLLLSFLRYLVFTVQFCLLLKLFDQNFEWTSGFLGLSLVFMLTAIVPTSWISDLPVKTSFAYYIYTLLGYDGTNAILCAILIWIINLLIPGLFGLFNLRRIKWIKLKEELSI